MARYTTFPKILKTEVGKRYYDSVIPDSITLRGNEVVYEATVGDRWDSLAYKYYRNAALWYEIARANNGLNGSIFIKPGTLVTIPEV